MISFVPDRGDLVWLDFSPQAGHEQAGRRPGFVVSSRAFNAKLNLAFICPVTSRVKGRGFEVLLPDGLPIQGAILIEHMKSVNWAARKLEQICLAPGEVLDEVLAKLNLILN